MPAATKFDLAFWECLGHLLALPNVKHDANDIMNLDMRYTRVRVLKIRCLFKYTKKIPHRHSHKYKGCACL